MHANETAGRDQGVLLTHFSNISFIDVQLVDTDRDNRLSAHEVGCALSSYIFALSRLFAFFD